MRLPLLLSIVVCRGTHPRQRPARNPHKQTTTLLLSPTAAPAAHKEDTQQAKNPKIKNQHHPVQNMNEKKNDAYSSNINSSTVLAIIRKRKHENTIMYYYYIDAVLPIILYLNIISRDEQN